MSARTVVVGSSIGGVRTAQALRAAGYDGEVVLVGAERALPYDKPPLSKALLAGSASADEITLLSEQAATDAGIRLVLGRAAVALDVAERVVELAGGERLPFDDVIVATGARARPSPWGSPPGVHVLRTLDDAVALGAALRRGGPLVVIGAGFVGAEVAATARAMGVEVTLVDPLPVPLGRVLDAGVARRFGLLHAERGVDARFGVGVAAIDEVSGGLVVRLADGERLPAATVLVAIGAAPNAEWLRSSGLRIDDGVLCDHHGRALGSRHVHAVGDVARWPHPRHGRSVRIEHWTNAVEQAACVAHNIVHPDALRIHEPVEYVWSDQYDWRIQFVGRTGPGLQHVVVDGADRERSFVVLHADADGRFAGAVAVNWPRALLACRRSVAASPPLAQVRRAVEAALPRPAGAVA
jgi:NADPH-dependent 2,4-dienoyl-CoA reductase/sulfur reductase-like enzyme